MKSITIRNDTKAEWDERKPSDCTHNEFAQYALDCVARDNGEVVDIDELVDEVTRRVASEIELAAYRGVKEGLDD